MTRNGLTAFQFNVDGFCACLTLDEGVTFADAISGEFIHDEEDECTICDISNGGLVKVLPGTWVDPEEMEEASQYPGVNDCYPDSCHEDGERCRVSRALRGAAPRRASLRLSLHAGRQSSQHAAPRGSIATPRASHTAG